MPRRGLPVGAPVEIRWSEHLVPFIAANSDRDLATALGLVHAHLRLAQIEFLRRIAWGRLAEVLGPVAVPLDHAVRALGITRAVPAIDAALPPVTRDWLEGFVAGVNHHLASAVDPPWEFRLLDVVAERWTIADVLAIARLAAADVNWLIWLRLLRLQNDDDWAEGWARLVAAGNAPIPNLGSGCGDAGEFLARLVLGLGRAGSNAVAIGGRRSATGQPWLAGDPHLSLSLPSVWLAAAYRSPSYNVAGLMIPGIPVMAIGRNPSLAWGGTNLHAGSSELFDVSGLAQGEVCERSVRLPVRWEGDREIVLRDTAYGPIITDTLLFGAAAGRTLALRWVGHQPSDEITALLAINRARDTAEFRRAAEGLAVPGQNLVFADDAGHIGRVRAAWLPRRPRGPPADLASPPAALAAWRSLATAAELPAEIDPPGGFVASANDRPPDIDFPLGWFFSPGDRAERLRGLLAAAKIIGLGELKALHIDVMAKPMLAVRDSLCAVLDPPPERSAVYRALADWDGAYDARSAGALAFELVLSLLVEQVVPPQRRALFAAVWHGRELLAEEVARLTPEHLAAALRTALARARPRFRRLRGWGRAHRLRLAHPIAALPLIGRRHRYLDWPWPGGRETLLKSAHGPVMGRHAVAYGSNARYLFDLSDPDGNRLVILGGQDGAPGSAAFLDQAALFRDGEYLEVPLRLQTARTRFPHLTLLQP